MSDIIAQTNPAIYNFPQNRQKFLILAFHHCGYGIFFFWHLYQWRDTPVFKSGILERWHVWILASSSAFSASISQSPTAYERISRYREVSERHQVCLHAGAINDRQTSRVVVHSKIQDFSHSKRTISVSSSHSIFHSNKVNTFLLQITPTSTFCPSLSVSLSHVQKLLLLSSLITNISINTAQTIPSNLKPSARSF